MENTELSFEEKLNKIKEIVNKLDDNSTNFNDLVIHFEEGLQLVTECRKFLNDTEQKIINISEKAKINETEVRLSDE